ncbi:MAG: nuclease-related domain-containing protein, partial [Pseudolysinimonas sp.]
MTDAPSTTKMMALRFAGTCHTCGRPLAAGIQAAYDRESRTVTCIACLPADLDLPTPGSGTAGASAQREHDKRAAKREDRIRTAHPKLGGLMLALSDEPQSTAAWQKGANGEVAVGAALDRLTPLGVQVLHDRRIPGTKANIDHIAVGPRGVFVIDAKKYQGMVRQQVD